MNELTKFHSLFDFDFSLSANNHTPITYYLSNNIERAGTVHKPSK